MLYGNLALDCPDLRVVSSTMTLLSSLPPRPHSKGELSIYQTNVRRHIWGVLASLGAFCTLGIHFDHCHDGVPRQYYNFDTIDPDQSAAGLIRTLMLATLLDRGAGRSVQWRGHCGECSIRPPEYFHIRYLQSGAARSASIPRVFNEVVAITLKTISDIWKYEDVESAESHMPLARSIFSSVGDPLPGLDSVGGIMVEAFEDKPGVAFKSPSMTLEAPSSRYAWILSRPTIQIVSCHLNSKTMQY
ncbi:hypothetical protein BV20DRAFT_231534 [Pilatotrama ljubarskyi]|nr:hypothetical protein BV20DRAFT_231534 [Pilatotrama ljubarskyi]